MISRHGQLKSIKNLNPIVHSFKTHTQRKKGAHRQIVHGFLEYIASKFLLECLTNRKSTEGNMLMILPSDIKMLQVYEEYVDLFESQ